MGSDCVGFRDLVRRWGPLPSLLQWMWRTVRYWRRSYRVVRTGSWNTVVSRPRMEIQRLAYSFITHSFWSSSEHRSRLACCRSPTFSVDQLGRDQAMAAAVNLQRDVGIMLSNLQVLSQFATSLHRMSRDHPDYLNIRQRWPDTTTPFPPHRGPQAQPHRRGTIVTHYLCQFISKVDHKRIRSS